MPPINPADIPVFPATLTIVPLEAANSNQDVFAFLCVFPTGTRFTVATVFPKGVVDPKMAKDFTIRITQGCIDRGDMKSADGTNWVSVTAMMQKLIVDFNSRRRGDALAQVECGTRLQ